MVLMQSPPASLGRRRLESLGLSLVRSTTTTLSPSALLIPRVSCSASISDNIIFCIHSWNQFVSLRVPGRVGSGEPVVEGGRSFCFLLECQWSQYIMHYQSIFPHADSPLLSAPQLRPSIRFPEDVQLVVRSDRPAYGNLYLGNIEAALNQQLLTSLQVTSLLSVADGYKPSHPREIVRHHKYIPIRDDSCAQLHGSLEEGVAFISEQMLVSNVLVHCVAGFSRSACFVVAYLMRERRMGLDEAISEVKRSRKMVQLSEQMREELRKYEVDLQNAPCRKNKYAYSVRVNSDSHASSVPPSCFQHSVKDYRSLMTERLTQQDRVIGFDQSDNNSERSSEIYKFSKASRC